MVKNGCSNNTYILQDHYSTGVWSARVHCTRVLILYALLAWPEFANLGEQLSQAFILHVLSSGVVLEGTGESYNFFFTLE